MRSHPPDRWRCHHLGRRRGRNDVVGRTVVSMTACAAARRRHRRRAPRTPSRPHSVGHRRRVARRRRGPQSRSGGRHRLRARNGRFCTTCRNCPDVDAVTVAAPTEAHASEALPFLERGVSALVEKPLTRTLDEADALVAAAARSGAILAVGHTERFNPAVTAALPLHHAPRIRRDSSPRDVSRAQSRHRRRIRSR